MRKLQVLLVALTILGLVVAACSSATPTSETVATEAPEAVATEAPTEDTGGAIVQKEATDTPAPTVEVATYKQAPHAGRHD